MEGKRAWDVLRASPAFAAEASRGMMGPNAVTVLREMLGDRPFAPGMRVLDLGCGKGLSSAWLALASGAHVTAVDLWIPAEENAARFRELGLEKQVEAVHADAAHLPFGEDSFDAVASVDAYHYFGANDEYFDKHLRPLRRDGAEVAVAVVGLKHELPGIPEEMRPYWDEESFRTWHSAPWWEERFRGRLDGLRVREMGCFDAAWADWLATGDVHAVHDVAMLAADGGRYMNLVEIRGRNR